MDLISCFREKVQGKNFTVVLPEGRDERIIQAARRLKDENIARPIVLGKPGQIEAAIASYHTLKDGRPNPISRADQRRVDRLLGALEAHRNGVVELDDKQYSDLARWWGEARQPIRVGDAAKFFEAIDRIICPGAYKGEEKEK